MATSAAGDTQMRRTIDLGKIAYNRTGRKANRVTIEVELNVGRLSICGNIWNQRETDCVSCGQNIDEIGRLFPNNQMVQRIVAIWDQYHLNDMQAGSPAQRAHLNGLGEQRPTGYNETLAELTRVGLQPDASYLYNGKPYAYGSAWLREEIPEEIIAEIEAWFE
ncbi:MAG: hypothetical protein EOP83_15845 [Verrucomicrobiaceae bacterium]|nr:MAG: hypothetical protein EOP83_15845 [Verrucomicrobiaceae bacterium]